MSPTLGYRSPHWGTGDPGAALSAAPADRQSKGAIMQVPCCAPAEGCLGGAGPGRGPDLRFMKHAACHFSLKVLSRSAGNSAVAAAAYQARTSMRDDRVGRTFSYRAKGGLLGIPEIFNWPASAEELWNAAERAEKHPRACVARELRIALPAELPLEDMARVVRGYALWLRDKHGVAIQTVIHAPEFHNKAVGNVLERCSGPEAWERYLDALFDPERSNRNFHAHILFSTRQVDGLDGSFGAKTRQLDDRTSGKVAVLEMRAEWEKRANAALSKAGSKERVDLRGYARMAEEGDAPEGLIPQIHLGPRHAARAKKMRSGEDDETSSLGAERNRRRTHNEQVWTCWEQLRALERQKARLEGVSAEVAERRERDRRAAAAQEKARIADAKTDVDRKAAFEAAASVETPDPAVGIEAAIRWANGEGETPTFAKEFEVRIEPEVSTSPDLREAPRNPLKVVRRNNVRVRTKGE